ncbi:MAG TPA: ATP-binding protein [Candidatus Udaeobacter sp.]|jgi:signal transduction histidine kinase|nr:ATP-binding protein [Candidatus Udaeobacter sp.]
MNIAIRRKTKPQAGFEEEYLSSLRECAAGGGEHALGRAYELGRRALTEQKSLVEMASLHHQAVLALVRGAKSEKRWEELLRSSAEFLSECLSPYEMTHRGFQDAVKALRHLNETLEEEIKRIAHAVHDEAGQVLVAVHIALAELAPNLPQSQHRQLSRIGELLNQVETQLRRFSHELRPTVLDDLGWLAAIRFLAGSVSKRTGIPIQVRTKMNGRLSGSLETALYRIVQEALTNAIKHAKPSEVRIDVRKEKHMLRCSIQDDGVGFDVRAVQSNRNREGLGLIGIQERLNALGGILSIDSEPGRGTTLLIRFPMEVPNAHTHRPR